MLFFNYHNNPNVAINSTSYSHKNLETTEEYKMYKKLTNFGSTVPV